MKKFLIACLVLVSTAVTAQQDPLVSNYRFNKFMLNPAVAGSAGQMVGRAMYRSQWTRFPGAPITAGASFHGLIGNRVGAGLNIVSDVLGITRTYGFQMAYSYHLPFDNFNLSLGLGARAMNWDLDEEQAVLVQPGDPALFGNDWVGDLSFGAYLYGQKWWAGISAPQVFQITSDEAYKLSTHIYSMGGYKFGLMDDKFSLEPMAFLRYVPDGGEFMYDINLRGYLLQDQLMLGFGYRAGSFLSAMAGFNVQDRYQFSYSYDFQTGDLQPYTWGSHEVTFGIKFGKQKIDFLKKKSADEQEEMPEEAPAEE